MYQILSQISHFFSQPFINIFYSIDGIPILAAFILGVVGALAPCQFTANLGAITIYGNKSIQNEIAWRDVIWFTLGKILVFSSFGLIVYWLGKEFQDNVTFIFPWVRKIMGPILILVGLFMLGVIKMKWSLTLGKIPDVLKYSKTGAFFMGVSFSLAFCPTMFVLFFITLMPIVLSTSYGAILPSIFAIGTSLPVIFSIFLISYFDLSGKTLKKKGRHVGQLIQRLAGGFLIGVGILDTMVYWL
ncbi:sulfite exporter TauE/SafE family protein [Bacillus sp. HMF5848]|uniref:urease accessory protein UreH domain-containing protein n=1 Tax=Bacillus sp. HMF5848 TaxID=2495421 RepID=UPI000F7B7971|nr:sulfite exporter TauE/SafE family protein [Bacillus sp. HMF5848]RSK26674.1 sulfite exporter TauE/SafE family protein [Bacillus sp. HMF5848]